MHVSATGRYAWRGSYL